MAWIEDCGSYFRVRARTADGDEITIGKCANREEAEACAAAVPKVKSNPAARRARREAARDRARWRKVHRPRPGDDPTLRTWIGAWRLGLDVAPSTDEKYDAFLRNHILPRFGSQRLSEFSRLEIRAWAKSLTGRLKPSSARSIVSLLAGILAEAHREGLITANPASRLRVIEGHAAERPVATPALVAAIAGRMDATGALLVITAAYTGMRWGELAALHRGNVVLTPDPWMDGAEFVPYVRVASDAGALHEVGGQLRLGPPKSLAAVRIVHLPLFLAALLREHLDRCAGPYVFTSPRGGMLRRSNFAKRSWSTAVAAVIESVPGRRAPMLESITFHDLRHAHKTWMAQCHTPQSLQNYRLGHTPRGVQGTYEHHTHAMVLDLMAELELRWQEAHGRGAIAR